MTRDGELELISSSTRIFEIILSGGHIKDTMENFGI
jgi:hypothetical protein